MEGSLTIRVFGLDLYAYGLLVMLGFWMAVFFLMKLSGRNDARRRAAALAAVLSLPLGLVLSRVMFVLLDPGFRPFLNIKNALRLNAGGFAMYGALLGAVLAALLAARLVKTPALRLLDALAPGLAAFLVFARLGEGFTSLGISRPLTTPFLINSIFARQDAYDAYLRTYLLESLAAFALLALLLSLFRKRRKPGLVFGWFCLLYGIGQTLMESLRYDGHLRYSFIGVQQVLSAVLFSLTLVILAVRALKAGRPRLLPLLTLISLPLVLAGVVGVEFLVDRSQLGKLFSYGLYVLVLAIPAALGILMLEQEEGFGQETDGPHQ